MHWTINSEEHIPSVLYQIRQIAGEQVSATNLTELETICSELLYNLIKHGSGGEISVERPEEGVIIEVKDKGAGFLEHVNQAFEDGFSTANSLGLGLPSVVRLSDQFELNTSNTGTQIRLLKVL